MVSVRLRLPALPRVHHYFDLASDVRNKKECRKLALRLQHRRCVDAVDIDTVKKKRKTSQDVCGAIHMEIKFGIPNTGVSPSPSSFIAAISQQRSTCALNHNIYSSSLLSCKQMNILLLSRSTHCQAASAAYIVGALRSARLLLLHICSLSLCLTTIVRIQRVKQESEMHRYQICRVEAIRDEE